MPKFSGRHPLIGFLKGTVRFAPGVDLTDPADPYWGLDLATFGDSLGKSQPPPGVSSALIALWWGRGRANGRDRAERRGRGRRLGACVSAPRRRRFGNARYWYARAGRRPAAGPLDEEWDAIAAALLAKSE